MDEFLRWGMTLCCAALAVGILHIISPGSSMEKIFRITLSVFFLCCVVSPLTQMIKNFEVKQDNRWIESKENEIAQEMEQIAEEIFEGSVTEQLQMLAQKKLEQMGINDARLSVYIIETDRQLIAEDIVVEAVLPQKYKERHNEIFGRLIYELGTTLRIGYADTQGEESGTE